MLHHIGDFGLNFVAVLVGGEIPRLEPEQNAQRCCGGDVSVPGDLQVCFERALNVAPPNATSSARHIGVAGDCKHSDRVDAALRRGCNIVRRHTQHRARGRAEPGELR